MQVDLAVLARDLEAAAKAHRPRNKAWTAAESDLVRQFYGKVPVKLLAEKLGRTWDSVTSHYRSLQPLA